MKRELHPLGDDMIPWFLNVDLTDTRSGPSSPLKNPV